EQQNPPSLPINEQQNPPSLPINEQQNPPSFTSKLMCIKIDYSLFPIPCSLYVYQMYPSH
ncbi:hypothetical protein, partial [Coleofasciculus sp.]